GRSRATGCPCPPLHSLRRRGVPVGRPRPRRRPGGAWVPGSGPAVRRRPVWKVRRAGPCAGTRRTGPGGRGRLRPVGGSGDGLLEGEEAVGVVLLLHLAEPAAVVPVVGVPPVLQVGVGEVLERVAVGVGV